MSKKITILAFIVSLALSFVLYGNTLEGEFVWDDVFFTQRTELRSVSHIPNLFTEAVLPHQQSASLYRPFTMATFTLTFAIFGDEPFGFHIVSILLNALAGFLVWRLVWRLFGNMRLAVFSALFYMFLPIHTEAVALMKARDELLGTIFILSSWLLFLRSIRVDRVDKKWLLLSAGVFFVGLLSKEFVIMGPPLFYLVYWIQSGIRPIKAKVRELLWGLFFFGAFLGVYLLMRHVAIPDTSFGNDDIGALSNVLVMPERWVAFLTAFKILFIYVSKTVIPLGLTASYHFKAVTLVVNLFASLKALGGLILLLFFLFLIFFKKTRATPFGIGSLIFLILYFPVSQFLFIGGDIVGERWMYLASVGIAVMIGWVFEKCFIWKRWIAIVLFSILLVWYASILIPRNLVWRNSFSLFQSMVTDSPKSVRGYSGLGQYYFEQGEYEKAVETINKGFAITDQEPNLFVVAASIAYKQGKFAQAEEYLRSALALPTFSSAAVINFPKVLYIQGKYKEALEWYDGAVSYLDPSEIGFQEKLLYASILFYNGQYEKSIQYILERIDPSFFQGDVAMLLAGDYYRLGEIDKSYHYYELTGLPLNEREDRLRNYKPK